MLDTAKFTFLYCGCTLFKNSHQQCVKVPAFPQIVIRYMAKLLDFCQLDRKDMVQYSFNLHSFFFYKDFSPYGLFSEALCSYYLPSFLLSGFSSPIFRPSLYLRNIRLLSDTWNLKYFFQLVICILVALPLVCFIMQSFFGFWFFSF